MTDDLPCDDLAVVTTPGTPGSKMAEGKDGEVLHNKENPCHHASRMLDSPTKRLREGRLGKDMPARPELRRLCDLCEWPDGAQAALEREVIQFRR